MLSLWMPKPPVPAFEKLVLIASKNYMPPQSSKMISNSVKPI